MRKFPNILKPLGWILKKAWFWGFLTVLTLAIIFRAQVAELTDDLISYYQYELQVQRLRRDFEQSQAERDFYRTQSEDRKKAIEKYETRLRQMDFELMVEKNRIRTDVENNRLEDGPLSSVTIETLNRIDELAKELP